MAFKSLSKTMYKPVCVEVNNHLTLMDNLLKRYKQMIWIAPVIESMYKKIIIINREKMKKKYMKKAYTCSSIINHSSRRYIRCFYGIVSLVTVAEDTWTLYVRCLYGMYPVQNYTVEYHIDWKYLKEKKNTFKTKIHNSVELSSHISYYLIYCTIRRLFPKKISDIL